MRYDYSEKVIFEQYAEVEPEKRKKITANDPTIKTFATTETYGFGIWFRHESFYPSDDNSKKGIYHLVIIKFQFSSFFI